MPPATAQNAPIDEADEDARGQEQFEPGGDGGADVRAGDEHGQAEEHQAAVEAAGEDDAQRRGDRGHEAGHGDHETGRAGAHAELGADRGEQAHREDLGGHDDEDAERHGGDGEPLPDRGALGRGRRGMGGDDGAIERGHCGCSPSSGSVLAKSPRGLHCRNRSTTRSALDDTGSARTGAPCLDEALGREKRGFPWRCTRVCPDRKPVVLLGRRLASRLAAVPDDPEW